MRRVKSIIEEPHRERYMHYFQDGVDLFANPSRQSAGTHTVMGGTMARAMIASIEAQIAANDDPALAAFTFKADDYITLKKLTSKVWFKNQTTSPIFVALYELDIKLDTATIAGSPSGPFQSAITAWANGMVELGAPANSEQQVGVTPFESLLFTQLCHVTNVHHWKLGIGESRDWETTRHNIRWSKNRVVDTDGSYYAGLTRVYMFVIHGDVNKETAVEAAHLGPACMSYVWSDRGIISNDADYMPDLKASIFAPIGFVPLTTSTQAIDYTNIQALVTTV